LPDVSLDQSLALTALAAEKGDPEAVAVRDPVVEEDSNLTIVAVESPPSEVFHPGRTWTQARRAT